LILSQDRLLIDSEGPRCKWNQKPQKLDRAGPAGTWSGSELRPFSHPFTGEFSHLCSCACQSSARVGHFGFQIKGQLKPMLIGSVYMDHLPTTNKEICGNWVQGD
ncbi:MAG: hypothetical protein V3R94_10895, partial [Acidobacteriota bacterium]